MDYTGEEAPLPEKPRQVQPMSKRHSRIAMVSSLLIAGTISHVYYSNQELEKQQELHSMQAKASDSGKPITHTSQKSVPDKVKEALSGDKKTAITTTINPAGQDPAFQVTTPEAIITGNKRGEIENIQPNENAKEPLPTTVEAQKTANRALKETAEETLPKKTPVTPTISTEEKN